MYSFGKQLQKEKDTHTHTEWQIRKEGRKEGRKKWNRKEKKDLPSDVALPEMAVIAWGCTCQNQEPGTLSGSASSGQGSKHLVHHLLLFQEAPLTARAGLVWSGRQEVHPSPPYKWHRPNCFSNNCCLLESALTRSCIEQGCRPGTGMWYMVSELYHHIL